MDVKLSCACGNVEGVATGISPRSGNRVVCCCSDCQAFAAHLERDKDILDEFGGTDLFQTSQSQIQLGKGVDLLRSVKVKKSGLIRWYTDCCRTPVGNSISAKNPFIGIVHNFMIHNGDRSADLGPVLAYVQTQYARGTPTYPHSAAKFPVGITLRMIRKLLLWKLQGKQSPSVFFSSNGDPVAEPVVLGKR